MIVTSKAVRFCSARSFSCFWDIATNFWPWRDAFLVVSRSGHALSQLKKYVSNFFGEVSVKNASLLRVGQTILNSARWRFCALPFTGTVQYSCYRTGRTVPPTVPEIQSVLVLQYRSICAMQLLYNRYSTALDRLSCSSEWSFQESTSMPLPRNTQCTWKWETDCKRWRMNEWRPNQTEKLMFDWLHRSKFRTGDVE